MWRKPYSKIQSNSCEKSKNKTAGGKLKETVVFSCKRGGMLKTLLSPDGNVKRRNEIENAEKVRIAGKKCGRICKAVL